VAELQRGMELRANPATIDGMRLIERLETIGVEENSLLCVCHIEEVEEEPLNPHGTETSCRMIHVSLPVGCEILKVRETALKS